MGIVITIPADGTQAIRSRETDQQPALQELQDLVDGYIEAVPHWDDYMGKPAVAYCNEDGKGLELAVNIRATALWWGKLKSGFPASHHATDCRFIVCDAPTPCTCGALSNDVLCGDVVLVVDLPDKEEDDG